MHEGTVTRTIGKTTYIANLHFKSQGDLFTEIEKSVESRLQYVNGIYFCSLTDKKIELGSKNVLKVYL